MVMLVLSSRFWSDDFFYLDNQFYWLVDEKGVAVVGNGNGWRGKWVDVGFLGFGQTILERL